MENDDYYSDAEFDEFQLMDEFDENTYISLDDIADEYGYEEEFDI